MQGEIGGGKPAFPCIPYEGKGGRKGVEAQAVQLMLKGWPPVHTGVVLLRNEVHGILSCS